MDNEELDSENDESIQYIMAEHDSQYKINNSFLRFHKLWLHWFSVATRK